MGEDVPAEKGGRHQSDQGIKIPVVSYSRKGRRAAQRRKRTTSVMSVTQMYGLKARLKNNTPTRRVVFCPVS